MKMSGDFVLSSALAIPQTSFNKFFFFSGCSCNISDQKSPKMDENWLFVMNQLLPQSKNGQNLRNSDQKSPKMDENRRFET
jgi:hypothetical protein